jgi:hypothetical protein
MATRVNVTSVEAIEAFRTSLILYLSKARPTLEEVAAEVTRTRVWVQFTQRTHWDGIAKKRARALEEANAALFSAKMSNLREVSSAEQMAVTKAKRGVEEAEMKLRVLRRWDRDFDNQTEPIGRQLEKLQAVLSDDLVKALAYLTQTVNTLQSYAGMVAPSLEVPAAPPTGEAQAANDGATESLENPAAREGGQS